MKICFLITGLGIGGAEKHLLKVVPKLKFDSFIISLSNDNETGKEIEKKGIKVYYLGLNKLNLISAIFKFRQIIKKEKPDVIDTYLIHANLFGRIFGRLFGVKKIVNSVRNDYSDLKFLSFLDRITRWLVDLWIPNSKALISYLKNNKVPLDKIKIIPNGIDIKEIHAKLDKKYDIRKELRIPKKTFVLACVARLHRQKNIETLVRAMRNVNNSISLAIAGDGEEMDRLVYVVEEHGLEKKVFLLGKRKDIPNILNSSDVFILPSLKEGMSNALLEAMALKKPCLVSNIPQNTSLVKKGINGFGFNPKKEKDIAEKINGAFKSKALKKMGEKSFSIIKEEYQIKEKIKEYEKVIANVRDTGI